MSEKLRPVGSEYGKTLPKGNEGKKKDKGILGKIDEEARGLIYAGAAVAGLTGVLGELADHKTKWDMEREAELSEAETVAKQFVSNETGAELGEEYDKSAPAFIEFYNGLRKKGIDIKRIHLKDFNVKSGTSFKQKSSSKAEITLGIEFVGKDGKTSITLISSKGVAEGGSLGGSHAVKNALDLITQHFLIKNN